ncbi:DNA primase [Sulfitobacter sp. D35]|uniref:DNA primase n=1 Tax=Sulfitobacter sp. D35 TaxID=3083252 RepID=UPI00296FB35C|nr:DNA primase [Sulfitobacter sp. D35]MDW4497013.1 DNA primase [Sulfitobacter sp. D35]
MSLPPGFLDELKGRLSLVQVVGRKVTWDMRKSNQGQGDMWAPCPFHQEKSASFHADDRRGYYKCFGCGAGGDTIKFVQETENVGFMEAIEILAREAGMPMPQRDPQAQQKADRRAQLVEVMEQAVRFFRLQLSTSAATPARDYLLKKRGLDASALERWEIGFAPDAWQGLWDHLKSKGVADDLILDAGLAKPSSKGGRPYDTFRNRIIFPIRDGRGRAIAFGGRAMDPEEKAKYLNSPETALFDKGRSLYNHGPARAAAGRKRPLVVAEGYMDVIALSEAGFEAAVAPLGTAVTENQLQMLWAISPEPVIALDGDKAGLGAAMRLVDLALPLLQAGKSLRFALMPDGKDPDDLLKAEGPEAMQALIDAAKPMVQLLWQRETEGRSFDSPERKAALEKALFDQTAKITDPTIKRHYEQALKDLRWQLFRAAPRPQRGAAPGKRWAQPGVLSSTKSTALAQGDDQTVTEHLREAVILAVLVRYPELTEAFESALETMVCVDADHMRMRDAILETVGAPPDAAAEKLSEAVGAEAIEKLVGQGHVAIVPCIRVPGNTEYARLTLAEEFSKLQSARGLRAEIAEAEEDLDGLADEGTTWRLGEAAQAFEQAKRSGQDDKTEFDLGENGARINRDERNAFDALLDAIRSGNSGR